MLRMNKLGLKSLSEGNIQAMLRFFVGTGVADWSILYFAIPTFSCLSFFPLLTQWQYYVR